jgi:hypothetical protein
LRLARRQGLTISLGIGGCSVTIWLVRGYAVALDRYRLIKLLNMTTSQHDAEVLVAIRKSNALLRQSRATWSEVLGITTGPLEDPAPPSYQTRPEGNNPREFASAQAFEARGLWKASVRADSFRAELRAIPSWLRLLFFPLWAGAEVVATTVIASRNSIRRAIGVVLALIVFLLLSGVYLALLIQLFWS